MNLTDPIADMLTRIRNASSANLPQVEMPHSKIKGEVTRIMKKEGYITDYVVDGAKKKVLRVYLKYDTRHIAVIRGLQRVSKPGMRKYATAQKLPKVLGGHGVMIVSTSSGMMTDAEAREKRLGGELICKVW